MTVANREAADGGATIIAGNRRVLAARLSDAKFFWENDLRVVHSVGLEGMAAGLASVTFHNRLGSQADRVARIAALAREIAPLVGADPEVAALAARVAKADLQSAMVAEFPELQGVMGGYYARAQGLDARVAAACRAHYQPLGPSDDVPTEPVSVAVALADKIDTLAAFWRMDEKPTGSKDPFALRRAGLGVLRIMAAGVFDISLRPLIISAMTAVDVCIANTTVDSVLDFDSVDDVDSIGRPTASTMEEDIRDLLAFLHDRLKVHLRDQGIRHDVIDACLAMPGNDDLTLLVKRAEALSATLKTEDGANLLQGFRRANNILTQAEAKDGVEYSYGADRKFAETEAERALFDALDAAEKVIGPALASEDFGAAMAAMAALRAPVDAFFTAVQVNDARQVIRRNRLNLLHRIRAICGQVADLTRLEG